MSKILDSGERTEFSTGAVRDMHTGKGRCDLLPLDIAAIVLGECQVLVDIAEFMDNDNNPLYLYRAIYSALNEHNADGKIMFDGCPHTMLLEVSVHFEDGATKYGEFNWQRGIPVKCYIDSAVRHYLKWLRGDDDERHDRAFMWNLICCLWEIKRQRGLKGVEFHD